MLPVALTWQRMMSRELFVATIDGAISYLFSWSASEVGFPCPAVTLHVFCAPCSMCLPRGAAAILLSLLVMQSIEERGNPFEMFPRRKGRIEVFLSSRLALFRVVPPWAESQLSSGKVLRGVAFFTYQYAYVAGFSSRPRVAGAMCSLAILSFQEAWYAGGARNTAAAIMPCITTAAGFNKTSRTRCPTFCD